MATRNIVPRANGEGQLGTAILHWSKLFADAIHEGANLGNNASLGYRQPSTAYTAGTIAYHSALPTGWYLECTTSGITGSGDLSISSPTVGGTVSDGTVVWTMHSLENETFRRINTSASDANLIAENCVTRIGPETLNRPTNIYGNLLSFVSGSSANGIVTQIAHNDYGDGDNGRLYYRNKTNRAGNWGVWKCVATTDDDGSVVAKSLGVNGYIKYASGLIVQWGTINTSTDTKNTSRNSYYHYYPTSFTNTPVISITPGIYYTNVVGYRLVGRGQTSLEYELSEAPGSGNPYIGFYIAIGY